MIESLPESEGKPIVQNSQARKEWIVLIGAMAANVVLASVLVGLFNLAFHQPSAPEFAPTEEITAPSAPTATATVFWEETMTPTITPVPTATDPPLPTPLPTLTPAPTRREFFEPTKPPYVFPTPIQIAPVPRAPPTATRAR